MKIVIFIFIVCFSASAFGQCTPSDQRIDCHPDPFKDGSSWESQCQARGCTWCETNVENAPWCYLPPNYGYRMVGDVESLPDGWRIQLQRVSQGSYFGGDSNFLTLQATYQSDYRLRIRITDRDTPRWEVPIQIDPPSQPLTDPLYEVYISNGTVFSMRIERKSTGTAIFDTGISVLSNGGGLTFSDQFIQIAVKLPTTNVFGLGEQEHHSLKHEFDYKLWPIYAKDEAPDGNANLYGSHPYYTVLEDDGSAHSVAIVNSNAQEFVMIPTPGYVYRTIGGVLDMYFFLGPTPENVVQQYTEAVGRPQMVPYWTLGFHLCRWGYMNLTNMRDTLERNVNAGIPVDVLYGDIDIMNREMDFTIDPINFVGLPEYVNEIKTRGIKFMTILDPAIANNQPPGSYETFDLGQEMDVWIKRQDGTPMVGRVWPGESTWPCYFPDYSKPATGEWWEYLIVKFLNETIKVDGMWIDMNEPANFEHGDMEQGCPPINKWNNPPYIPHVRDNLTYKTLCLDHVDHASVHYNTHSLYGWFQSESTLRAMRKATDKRSFVLSRSTFLGSGRWLSHWLGDNFSKWEDMFYSIIGMIEFNQFGIPMVGADICGFSLNAQEEMCQRWMQLGAFYPFSRNHNGIDNRAQDPAAWSQNLIESSKKALEVRYTLIPYLYTLFYHSAVSGNTVVRALWHEYPTDSAAILIDKQFLWGDGLMISPVLNENATSINAYFPDSRFYSYYNGALVSTRGGFTQLAAPLDFINVHVKGGKVLPTQEPAANTEISRNNPFGFIVALDDSGNASGDLYYDDGDSQDPVQKSIFFYGTYSVTNRRFSSTVVNNGYSGMGSKRIGTVRIFGAPTVTSVTVNGNTHTDFDSNIDSGEVFIYNLNLTANSPFVITF